MSTEETVTFNLEVNVEPVLSNIRQIEGLLFRTLGYLQRLGLPPDMMQALHIIQRIVLAIRLAHSALIALQVAAGPIGWWRAALGLTGSLFAVGSLASEAGYDNTRGT